MPVPVRVVALTEKPLVLRVGQRGVVHAVGGVEGEPAGDRDDRERHRFAGLSEQLTENELTARQLTAKAISEKERGDSRERGCAPPIFRFSCQL